MVSPVISPSRLDVITLIIQHAFSTRMLSSCCRFRSTAVISLSGNLTFLRREKTRSDTTLLEPMLMTLVILGDNA